MESTSAKACAISTDDAVLEASSIVERGINSRPIIDSVKQFIREHGQNASGARQVQSTTASSNSVVSNNITSRNSCTPSMNPIIDWEEPIEIPNLSLFELYRSPRRIVCDTKERIQIPAKTLHDEFCCPICLGYIKRTSIVMECLHRFCAECIEKCLRLGRKECPSCRVHIPSRRALRADPNFDRLIGKIYGDIIALEQKEEAEIKIYNKDRNINNAYSKSRRKAMLNQAIQRRRKSQGGRPSVESRTEVTAEEINPAAKLPSLPPSTVEFLQESSLINFILRKDPKEEAICRLDKECLRTNVNLPIISLKMFLTRKLVCQEKGNMNDIIQIYILSDKKQLVTLDDSITLGEIQAEFWNPADDELILYYRMLAESNSADTSSGLA